MFLTSTAGRIMPIVEIDGRAIGDGKPGPASQRMRELYWALRESGRHGTPSFLRTHDRSRRDVASAAAREDGDAAGTAPLEGDVSRAGGLTDIAWAAMARGKER